MLLPRLIPVLLLRNRGLVKTTKFGDDRYVGDPLNAVRIFNEKQVDELIVLDLDATVKNLEPDYRMIENLAAECRMPLCYGGGIKTASQANQALSLGVEKISLSASAIANPELVTEIAEQVGSQSVVVTLDVKRKLFGGLEVFTHNGTRATKSSATDLAGQFQHCGVGELVINFIDNDGTLKGYDLNAIRSIKSEVSVPMTVIGGCGSLNDIQKLYEQEGLIGAGVGSLFVFKGKYRAVLITYPSKEIKGDLVKAG